LDAAHKPAAPFHYLWHANIELEINPNRVADVDLGIMLAFVITADSHCCKITYQFIY